MRIPCAPHAAHLWGPYGFYHDAARRVATVFEKWNFLIETDLRARSENPPELNPYGLFAAVSLLEYGGLKPILPFLGGRSDTARRVVIPLYAISVYARMGINDGRWQCPAMPTVGAGSSQREDSPAHRISANARAPIDSPPNPAMTRLSVRVFSPFGTRRFKSYSPVPRRT